MVSDRQPASQNGQHEELTVPLLASSTGDVEHDAAAPDSTQQLCDGDADVPDAKPAPGPQASTILRLAGPLIAQNVFGYSLSIVAAVAVGHLGDASVLSAVVLAGSFYNVTGYSLIVGLSSGSDTLSGQAYGAAAYGQLGAVLQRAVALCWAASVPLCVLWVNAGPVLAAAHQSADIADKAARYLRLIAPTIFVSSVSSNVQRYLLAQRVVKPASICTIITACLCPLYNYLLIYRWQLGLDGAAAAFFVSNFTYALLLVVYTAWRDARMAAAKDPRCTWPGLSARTALSGWGVYLRYGAPAAAMVCAEWWVFELVILFAGTLATADVAVAVMGIAFHVTALAYMIPMGVGQAVNTTIANALGAGAPERAAATFRAGLAMVGVTQAVLSTSLFVLRAPVVAAFTDAPPVIALAASTMPAVCATVVADGMNSLLTGVLRGCGRQAWGAWLNLIGYWCIGFPLSLLLGFTFKMTTVGFWTALCIASSTQALIMMAVIFRIDWGKEVERAQSLVANDMAGSGAGSECEGSQHGSPDKAAGGHTGRRDSLQQQLRRHSGARRSLQHHEAGTADVMQSAAADVVGRHDIEATL